MSNNNDDNDDDDDDRPSVKFFFHQSIGGGSPLNGFTTSSMPSSPMNNNNNNVNVNNSPNSSQTNQLFRMAALTMMSKLFSALRSQGNFRNFSFATFFQNVCLFINSAMTPPSPKIMMMMENIPKMATGSADIDHSNDNHEIDLDDDDDDDMDGDNDRTTTETISVPILLGQKSRQSSLSSNSIQDDSSDSDQTIRTTIMYGRPSPPSSLSLPISPPLMMMGPRYYPTSPQNQQSPTITNPLAAIIQAIASQTRNQPNYNRQLESQPINTAAAEQPQRLILLITHRSMPNVEPSSREESSPTIM